MLPEVHLAGEERAGCNLVEIVMESVDVPTHLPQLISTKRQSYYRCSTPQGVFSAYAVPTLLRYHYWQASAQPASAQQRDR
jgi:hypothetical protein